MAEQELKLKPVIADNVSDATEKIILNAIESGYDLNDISESKEAPVIGRRKITNEGIDEVVNLTSKGRAIPGQSLTNSKEQPYPWESPPTFTNPREALDNIVSTILNPKGAKHIVNALAKGASVTDLSLSILYAKFANGEITPDVMLLLSEPVMYTIMGIGEEANIKYNIDDNDIDEVDVEDEIEQKNKIKNLFSQIKNNQKPLESVVPSSILERIKEQGPEIRKSLLSKGEE
jgi:hypothetical protein